MLFDKIESCSSRQQQSSYKKPPKEIKYFLNFLKMNSALFGHCTGWKLQRLVIEQTVIINQRIVIAADVFFFPA